VKIFERLVGLTLRATARRATLSLQEPGEVFPRLFRIDDVLQFPAQGCQGHRSQRIPPGLVRPVHGLGDGAQSRFLAAFRLAGIVPPDLGAGKGAVDPFHRFHDIEEGNPGGRSREPVAARGAEGRLDDAGLRQSLQGLGQVFLGHTVERGQILGGDERLGGHAREDGAAVERPFDLIAENHAANPLYD
jgi:hypothetical protein